jgi:hypothetical protein
MGYDLIGCVFSLVHVVWRPTQEVGCLALARVQSLYMRLGLVKIKGGSHAITFQTLLFKSIANEYNHY